jgi:hypothetical protein
MTAIKRDVPFEIIRHRGIQNRGQLPDRTWVYGMDKIFFEEVKKMVPVAPYDDFFIYELPKKYPGPRWVCSCGSMAVCAGYSAYEQDASAQGLLFVCYSHSTTGHHLNGSRWI